jgi:hypothetical protein
VTGSVGGWLAVDFGTSNTVAVARRADGPDRPLLFDGSPLLASAVYAADREVLVGRDAWHQARDDPARLEPNPKRRIDDGTVLLGERVMPVVDLIGAVLGRVAAEARAVLGHLPPVVLTCPAAWGQHRRAVLTDAAATVGMTVVDTITEPAAAARYYTARLGRSVPLGAELAVFDLGGGTLDVAVVRRDPEGFTVVGSGGADDLGGLDFDAALLTLLGQRITGTDPAVWSALHRPATPAQVRARLALWQDIRTAKELLSRASVATVHVPGVEVGTHITRSEYEAVAAPLADRAAGIAAEVLAGRRPVGLFLVGGGSRTPLVAERLHRRLGIAPLVLEQPELVVAEGALHQATDLVTRIEATQHRQPGPAYTDAPDPLGERAGPAAVRPAAIRRPAVLAAVVLVVALLAGVVWWQTRDPGGNSPSAVDPTATGLPAAQGPSASGAEAFAFSASRPSQLVADDTALLAAVTRWDGMAWDGCRLADDADHRPDGSRHNPVALDPTAAPERVVHCQQSTFSTLFARYQSNDLAGEVAIAYQRGGRTVPTDRAKGLPGTLVEIDRWSPKERALIWRHATVPVRQNSSVIIFMVTGRADIDLITVLHEFAGPT